jgi:hypothetical protein
MFDTFPRCFKLDQFVPLFWPLQRAFHPVVYSTRIQSIGRVKAKDSSGFNTAQSRPRYQARGYIDATSSKEITDICSLTDWNTFSTGGRPRNISTHGRAVQLHLLQVRSRYCCLLTLSVGILVNVLWGSRMLVVD